MDNAGGKSKTVIVTGASDGIGAAAARILAVQYSRQRPIPYLGIGLESSPATADLRPPAFRLATVGPDERRGLSCGELRSWPRLCPDRR
jgi:hypothetical protein